MRLFGSCFRFGLWLGLFALVFALGFCLLLLAFWCGKLLEGKRNDEGKELLRGIAQEGLIESLH
jgi:hypothetical protein